MNNGIILCTLNKRGFIPIIRKYGPLTKPFKCTTHQYEQLKSLGYDIRKVKHDNVIKKIDKKLIEEKIIENVVSSDTFKDIVSKVTESVESDIMLSQINKDKSDETELAIEVKDKSDETELAIEVKDKSDETELVVEDPQDWSFEKYTKGRLRPKSRKFIESLLDKEGLSKDGNKQTLIDRLVNYRIELENI